MSSSPGSGSSSLSRIETSLNYLYDIARNKVYFIGIFSLSNILIDLILDFESIKKMDVIETEENYLTVCHSNRVERRDS